MSHQRLCSIVTLCILSLGIGIPEKIVGAPAPLSTPDDFGQSASRDWPMAGGDWGNTRYSSLSQINTRNVRKLGRAWVSKTFDEGGVSRGTPVVKNGLMFVTAGRKVYALNARTGEEVWSYKTLPDEQSPGRLGGATGSAAYTLGIPNPRGVGVGQGLVFAGLVGGQVIALCAETGELLWVRQTGIDQPKKQQIAAVAPTYVNGELFTGLSNGDAHQRGRLLALDANTGNKLWQMFSIPDPGEPGYDSWPPFNDAWKFGGGGVWTEAPVDPELGIVYWTTGNAVPPFAGDWRPGDNLYTDSVLAVDMHTGKLRWYYQLVHHDLFEGDAGTPLILYQAQIGGKSHRAIAALRADGYLFQLDRETGKPILQVKELPVPQLESQKTSHTQPFPVGGESVLMSCLDWRKESIPAGFVLGCMWTPPASPPPSNDPQNVLAPFPSVRASPMAYSPQTGYFYTQGISMLQWPRRAQDPYFFEFYWAFPDLKIYGDIAAIDSRTGRVAWKKRIPIVRTNGVTPFAIGGPVVTAGGLMFRVSGDGNFDAYDAMTGDVLWRFQTGVAGASGSPASYEVDGEQYVAVSMGAAIWAFKLGGTASTAITPPVSSLEEELLGAVVDTDEIETTSLERSLFGSGTRYFIDEYMFNPRRARVTAGTRVLFVNNGNMGHEIVGVDGSWGTGPLSPTQESWVRFDKPGEYAYICKNHPWVYGQLSVVAADSRPPAPRTSNTDEVRGNSVGFAEQAIRGKEQFNRSCSTCHGEDLGGHAGAPALLGNTFSQRWKSASIGDLFDNIRTTMPQSSPGSLNRQTYLNIVAYLLRANSLYLKSDALKDDPHVLANESVGERARAHAD